MKQAVDLSKDPLLGLHVGEQIKPGYYGPLGYIAMSCATLGAALQKHLQYQQLVSNHGQVKIDIKQEVFKVIWQPQIKDVDRHVVENIFSAWVCFGRWICAQDIVPLDVTFQHASSEDQAEYQRVFRCPVKFAQAENALYLPLRYLEQTLVQTDSELRQHFEHKAAILVQTLQQEDDEFLQELKVWMTHALLQGNLTLESTADHFELTPRSLQRRLAQRQQSYKAMLDIIRQELAQQYVCDQSINLAEVTFILGFADQPSFQRAFKRWTGKTPGHYRKQKSIG